MPRWTRRMKIFRARQAQATSKLLGAGGFAGACEVLIRSEAERECSARKKPIPIASTIS